MPSLWLFVWTHARALRFTWCFTSSTGSFASGWNWRLTLLLYHDCWLLLCCEQASLHHSWVVCGPTLSRLAHTRHLAHPLVALFNYHAFSAQLTLLCASAVFDLGIVGGRISGSHDLLSDEVRFWTIDTVSILSLFSLREVDIRAWDQKWSVAFAFVSLTLAIEFF